MNPPLQPANFSRANLRFQIGCDVLEHRSVTGPVTVLKKICHRLRVPSLSGRTRPHVVFGPHRDAIKDGMAARAESGGRPPSGCDPMA
jgi:hypothetical protein